MQYSFPATLNALLLVMNHLMAFGIEVQTVSKIGEKYYMVTSAPVPQDQLAHLELTVM